MNSDVRMLRFAARYAVSPSRIDDRNYMLCAVGRRRDDVVVFARNVTAKSWSTVRQFSHHAEAQLCEN